MNHIEVARKLREQIHQFLGIFYPHFSKPKARFIEQMVYGIQASQDVKLSSIGRALNEGIELKKTEERLSRHLDTPGLGQKVNEIVAEHGARKVQKDTLIIVDPSDIRKEYAKKMPYLAQVRDANKKELANGYWICDAVACEPSTRRMIPLHQRLWSANAPDFESELRFIVRLVGTRHLKCRGRSRSAEDIGRGCRMLHIDTIVKEEEGKEKTYRLEYGFRKVKLPGREEQLYLVVVKGYGKEPILLLTNVPVTKSRKSLWFIVSGYFTRWLIEETIRFIKQSYHLEDIRVRSYERLRNLVALVLAAAYFSAAWLGESLKLTVLATRVLKAAKRFFGVPDFHYCALADGIAVLLSRLGKWRRERRERFVELDQAQGLLFDGL